MQDGSTDLTPALLRHDPALAEQIVREAGARYFASRRARADAFVDRHFTMRGSLRLHRHALGWDVLRAPANLLLMGPNIAVQLAAAGADTVKAKKAAQYLRSRRLLLRTAVGDEVEWLVITDFLQLPCQWQDRESGTDALAEAVLADPRVVAALADTLRAVGEHADDPAFRARLEDAVAAYTGTRAAAADIATALITVSAGASMLHQFTPGTISLGTTLAAAIAHHAAVASFPLGSTIGGLWYGLFSVSVSPLLVAGTTLGLTAVASVATAFAGVLADPIQRRAGLHQRRLLRLVDVLEAQFDGDDAQFTARDHYVARLLDLGDMLASVYRVARA